MERNQDSSQSMNRVKCALTINSVRNIVSMTSASMRVLTKLMIRTRTRELPHIYLVFPQWYDVVHFGHKSSQLCFGTTKKVSDQWKSLYSLIYHRSLSSLINVGLYLQLNYPPLKQSTTSSLLPHPSTPYRIRELAFIKAQS